MLPEPDKIAAFLETIADMPCRLSIKTRIGRRSSAEIQALMPIFNSFPLEELIIHPRLGVQLYKGVVDLDVFADCLTSSTNPVTYNGDICTLEDFNRLAERFPKIQKWMIGRGALTDPFLPGAIKGISIAGDPLQVIKSFHDDLYNKYSQRLSGDSHLLGRMKAVWFYLAGSFPNHNKLLKKIQKTKKIASYTRLIDDLFHGENPDAKHR